MTKNIVTIFILNSRRPRVQMRSHLYAFRPEPNLELFQVQIRTDLYSCQNVPNSLLYVYVCHCICVNRLRPTQDNILFRTPSPVDYGDIHYNNSQTAWTILVSSLAITQINGINIRILNSYNHKSRYFHGAIFHSESMQDWKLNCCLYQHMRFHQVFE